MVPDLLSRFGLCSMCRSKQGDDREMKLTTSKLSYLKATGEVGCAVTSCVGTMDVNVVCGKLLPGQGVVAAQAYLSEDGECYRVGLGLCDGHCIASPEIASRTSPNISFRPN